MSLSTMFGPEAGGGSPEAAAKLSQRKFVRSKGGLAVYDASRNPTGHVFTAWEAYDAYGAEILEEAVEYGSAILKCTKDAISDALKSRREDLNLSRRQIARAAALSSEDVVRSAENAPSQVPIREIEQIALVLGLDERWLAFKSDSGGDEELAYRLRTLSATGQRSATHLSAHTALLFAEAASIIRVQLRLQRWLAIETERRSFAPSDDYGSRMTPAWKVGYRLAEDARRTLRLGEFAIPSMRALVEDRLGIPVVQVNIGQKIAGATIVTRDEHGGEARGVILNASGANENVWVRRATLAHELGHLLFDPNEKLQNVRVDPYDQSEADPQAHDAETDYVEQRANAFAIAFLAPPEAVQRMVSTPPSIESVVDVMHTYGISQTAARYHVRNCHHGRYSVPAVGVNDVPRDELRAAEDLTLDFFPLRSTSIQRRGKFAALVTQAVDEGYISEDTASLYLQCTVEEFRDRFEALQDLHRISGAAAS